jgi:hypothetical protein
MDLPIARPRRPVSTLTLALTLALLLHLTLGGVGLVAAFTASLSRDLWPLVWTVQLGQAPLLALSGWLAWRGWHDRN